MIRDLETRQAAQVMDWLGIPRQERFRQQLEVLATAMDIHVERTEVRGDTWAQFDHHDCIHHMSSKLARIKGAAQQLAGIPHKSTVMPEQWDGEFAPLRDKLVDAILDDALDMINYSAFLVRHLTARMPAKVADSRPACSDCGSPIPGFHEPGCSRG